MEQDRKAFLRAGRALEKATFIATTTGNVGARARAKQIPRVSRATHIVLSNNQSLSLARSNAEVPLATN